MSYKIEAGQLEKILQSFNGKRIVVIGDLMLDHYLWGQVDRISPEAPVPIVDVQKQEYRLGGAANVVNNIASLKGTPVVVGLIGADSYADTFVNIFTQNQVKTEYILKDSTRTTTVKTRVFAAGQQVIRYDFEQRHDISEEIESKVLHKVELAIAEADAVIIEDYNKGLLTPKIIRHAINKANSLKIPITVDPKYNCFFEYQNCTVFKPNLAELQKNLNIEIKNDKDLNNAANQLFDRISPEYLVITLGEKGLIIFDKEKNITQIPTFAKEVFDVCGAGDTVISVLTLCLSIGLDIKTSAIIANHAAGAVCGKRGINPATADDITMSVKYNNFLGETHR